MSAKNNPKLSGEEGLEGFEDFFVLSDKEKADRWMSKWLETAKPFYNYNTWLTQMNSVYGDSHAVSFAKIKNFYNHFVINQQWNEKKYVAVLDEILKGKINRLSIGLIEEKGDAYENGMLQVQRNAERKKRL